MVLVNWVILIAGVAGLLVAGYGLVTLVRHALRTRRYGDIAIAVVVAVARRDPARLVRRPADPLTAPAGAALCPRDAPADGASS